MMVRVLPITHHKQDLSQFGAQNAFDRDPWWVVNERAPSTQKDSWTPMRCTHALHHDLPRHFTLLYTLTFAFPLSFLSLLQTSFTPLSWNYVLKWERGKARRYWQRSAMPKFFSLCNWKWMQILVCPRVVTYIVFHYSLKTCFISIYLQFAFHFVCIVL